MYIIYQITNTINSKMYFGITKNTMAKRWSGHKSEARRGSNTKFHKAIRKYGEDCWDIQELTQCCGDACASYLEDALIMGYNSIEEGYNSCPGGYQSTKMPGYKHTPEAMVKIRAVCDANKIPVYQFDGTGTLIQRWDSAMDAAIGVYSDRTASSNVSKCAKRYKGQTYIRKAGFPPYSFGYTNESPPPAHIHKANAKRRGADTKSQAIIQYTITGEFIKMWKSSAEAARELDIPAASVHRVVRGEMSQTHGFVFVLDPYGVTKDDAV